MKKSNIVSMFSLDEFIKLVEEEVSDHLEQGAAVVNREKPFLTVQDKNGEDFDFFLRLENGILLPIMVARRESDQAEVVLIQYGDLACELSDSVSAMLIMMLHGIVIGTYY